MNFINLKNVLHKIVQEYNTPGVDCLVYHNHKPIFRYYTGMSDIENHKPVQGDELYTAYSLTKLTTCTAALQLLEQGKYQLDDPVYLYLPEFEKMKLEQKDSQKEGVSVSTTGIAEAGTSAEAVHTYAKNHITVKHLFTMSAGLDYAIGDEAITKAVAEGKKTTRELVGAIANKVLHFEPGTDFDYSLCHDVLGALIEVWSGQRFGEYVKEHIFLPLGMKNTFFGLPKDEQRISKMTVQYCYGADAKPIRLPMENKFSFTEEYESGGAGLTTTVEDYALLLDALACMGIGKTGAQILSPETIRLMRTNQMNEKQLQNIEFQKIRPGYGYGLGVRTHIDKEKSGNLSPLGEFGWDGAAGAFAMVDADNQLSLTYFQQIFGWNSKIQTELRNALYTDLDGNI